MESAELLLNYSVPPFLPRVINTNVMMGKLVRDYDSPTLPW